MVSGIAHGLDPGARFMLAALALVTLSCNSDGRRLPVESPAISGIEWAPESEIVRLAEGIDNWPLTWAEDGALITAYGDGWGFEPAVPEKLSLGLARVYGDPPEIEGVNIRSSTAEQLGDGPKGKKASGMLMVGGVLYMWVRNANNEGRECQLARSDDHGESWSWSDWHFAELGYCAFLNFGRNYEGARDDFVYSYSPDTSTAYHDTDRAVLLRVPKDRAMKRVAYEFFAGLTEDGAPRWTSDFEERAAVITVPGGVNRLDVVYNAPLRRYLMTMRDQESDERNRFAVYAAPQPWGPWRTVFATRQLDDTNHLHHDNFDWGEAQHFPSKWISDGGTTMYLVFSGGDSFSVRRAELVASGR